MKTVFVSVILVIFVLPGVIFAFHEGGSGYCQGCHVFHVPPGNSNQTTSAMLIGSDPSSTCLRCHAEAGQYYNVLSFNGSSYTPGGDFYWLKKTFTWKKGALTFYSEGDNHGHNIVANDYGAQADITQTAAPGGTYPSSGLSCISCHNPHARTGVDATGTPTENYRLLGGDGYSDSTNVSGTSFTDPAPIAAYDAYDWTESDTSHVAYGSGMSEWCGNCHVGFLNNSHMHPAGNNEKLSPDIINNYNAYIKTGDMNGNYSTAYLALVPFEQGITDATLLDPWSTSGPDPAGTANVMCLTCHRAHASAFNNIGRWDFSATFLADSHPQYGDDEATGDDVFNSYYGRDIVADFGEYQSQLCNKCHVQD
ncbi:MAG: hypothetical protein AMK71_06390 [Nitrospira bacterium SG8_35_4]|nr:MAG: hypothetical protein AMK71_06390 [Nitrospira bacterium SG8_35_4]